MGKTIHCLGKEHFEVLKNKWPLFDKSTCLGIALYISEAEK